MKVCTCVAVIVFGFAVFTRPVAAVDDPPPTISDLSPFSQDPHVTEPESPRHRAMRVAAIRYGAQAGLARRTYEIAQLLERNAEALSRIFRFDELMLTESGFLLQPPVIIESRNAYKVERNGLRAASADRVYRVQEKERIVPAAPVWRDYLMREWRKPQLPPSTLAPQDAREAQLWERWQGEGWESGIALADAIFSDDIERLSAQFEGLVRWHHLRLAGMTGSTVVTTDEVPVSGDGTEMRIAARAVSIARPSSLHVDTGRWRVLSVPGTP